MVFSQFMPGPHAHDAVMDAACMGLPQQMSAPSCLVVPWTVLLFHAAVQVCLLAIGAAGHRTDAPGLGVSDGVWW
jgi:hypothetical protein